METEVNITKGLYIFYAIGVFSVIGGSMLCNYIFRKFNCRKVFYWIVMLLIITSSYMLVLHYLKYRTLHFFVDFSSWTHLLYNVINSGKPLSFNEELLRPGCINYFSSHFVPLIYVLALPFKLCPKSETLIIMNFVLMASSVAPLYKLALHYDNDRRFGLFMAVLLLWYPTFQYTVLYEFDMLRFSIPIILWMLYFWESKIMILYFLFAALAVFVREEVGLTVMMFGIYLTFFKKESLKGLLTVLIGLGAFIAITEIIMPSLREAGNSNHIAIVYYEQFGKTPGEIITNILRHPLFALIKCFQPIKLANIFMYFLPLLFIPLLAPAVMISILVNIGVGLLSLSHTHTSYMLYYLSPSVPFIFYAFIKGWPKFLAILGNLMPKHYPSVDIKYIAMMTVFSGLLLSSVFFGPSPISLQFWFKGIKPAPFKTQDFHRSAYRITDHHRKVEEICKLIPDSAIVSAHYFLFPRLFKKRGVLVFPHIQNLDGKIKANYVFFDKTNNSLTKKSNAYKTQCDFDIVEKDKNTWSLVKSEDGYFLYKMIKSYISNNL